MQPSQILNSSPAKTMLTCIYRWFYNLKRKKPIILVTFISLQATNIVKLLSYVYIHSLHKNLYFLKPQLQPGYCHAWDYNSHCHCQCLLHLHPVHWRTLQQGEKFSCACLLTSKASWRRSQKVTYWLYLKESLQETIKINLLVQELIREIKKLHIIKTF